MTSVLSVLSGTAVTDCPFLSDPVHSSDRPAFPHRRVGLAGVAARLFAYRYDRQLAGCAMADADGPLAAHATRLVSRKERVRLADWVCTVLKSALTPPRRDPIWGPVIPICGLGADAPELMRRIIARLRDSRPVSPRGMARLRMLLSDGAGPLYAGARDNLAGELRCVIAAL